MCGTYQRMMIKGNYVDNDSWSRFPDMGYSFCNCRDIFFTKWENLTDRNVTWNNCQYLTIKLMDEFNNGASKEFTISMLDPFFIDWTKPHEMWHWLVRKVYYLIDMDSFCELCKEVGFEVVSAVRDMNVESTTPQNFHVTVRKP